MWWIGPLIGWLGNLFLIAGHFAIGYKWRMAFVIIAIGEVFWLLRSIQLGILDGVFLGVVFLIIQIVNWRKWK